MICASLLRISLAAGGMLLAVPPWPAGEAASSSVPALVKEVVTFLFLKGEKGAYLPLGTAFFVGIEEEQPHRGYGYLVTAKHVLQDPAKRFFPSVFIRLNKKAGGAEIVEIPLRGSDAPPVYQHPDAEVDLAVIPMLPNQDRYSFKFVPQEMLLPQERVKEVPLREGEEVFFAGLFWQFVGERRNYPMIRFGHVSLVTEERIPWRGASGIEWLELFLIEAQSTAGTSGAPVFVHAGGGRSELRLAGVIKGVFLDPKALAGAGKPVPLVPENMGVTAVVPAHKLHEVLYSPALQKARQTVSR